MAGPSTPLSEHRWIAPDDSLAHLASARWLRRELPRVTPAVRCNSVAAMHTFARSGAGLAPLPCFLGEPHPALERVTPPLPELVVGLWLLTRRDLRSVPVPRPQGQRNVLRTLWR